MSVQIQGMADLIKRIQGIPNRVTAAITAELQDGAQAIAAEAKQRAPGDQGFLRQNIGVTKNGPLSFEVFSGAEYSAFVEFGTLEKVDVPPDLQEYAAQFRGGAGITSGGLSAKDAIFAWCERQGIDQKLWYPIFISIMVHGVRPQPFFFPAAARQAPIIIKRVQEAVEAAL